jgi:hypothetical protein
MKHTAFLSVVAFIVGFAALLPEQEITGDIRGVVKGPTGAMIAARS